MKKVFDIAIKDMTRSFRSYFALVMMFAVPILLTSMFYIMFGGSGEGEDSAEIPITPVIIANLDEGQITFDPVFQQGLPPEYAQNINSGDLNSMGEFLTAMLQNESLASLIAVTTAESEAAAKAAVDAGQAAVAIILPPNFSEAITNANTGATVELYQDPTLTLGPGIVKGLLNQFLDGFSGSRITLQTTFEQLAASGVAMDENTVQTVIAAYFNQMAAQPSTQDFSAALNLHNPEGETVTVNAGAGMIGMMLAGMTVFYVFFTGASSAQSILTENENGTLARLFTTPTSQVTILAGKFLAGFFTILIQIIVLIGFGYLAFQIDWGQLLTLVPVVLSTVIAATCFGIFLISLVKTERQAGGLIGGGVTILGMLGMMPIFVLNLPNPPQFVFTASKFVPQGWAVQGLRTAMEGGAPAEVAGVSLALLAWAVAFFVLGVARFRSRFA